MKKLSKIQPRINAAPDRLQAGDSWRSDKQGANARGYTYQWQQARLAFLQAHPLCIHCRELGIVSASSVVDHRIPHRGCMVLFWNRDNWQALCAPCHAQWKQAQEHNL